MRLTPSASNSLSCFVGVVALLSPLGALAGRATCESPQIGASRAPMVSPPLGAVVVGTGRLQFYSANYVGLEKQAIRGIMKSGIEEATHSPSVSLKR